MSTINYYEVHKSLGAARAYKEMVERNYHPMGYGTSLTIETDKLLDGTPAFIVKGYRFSSCD